MVAIRSTFAFALVALAVLYSCRINIDSTSSSSSSSLSASTGYQCTIASVYAHRQGAIPHRHHGHRHFVDSDGLYRLADDRQADDAQSKSNQQDMEYIESLSNTDPSQMNEASSNLAGIDSADSYDSSDSADEFGQPIGAGIINGLTHDLGRVAATGQMLAVKAGHGAEDVGSAAVKGAAGTIVAGEHGVGHIKDGVKQVQHDGKTKAALNADVEQASVADYYADAHSVPNMDSIDSDFGSNIAGIDSADSQDSADTADDFGEPIGKNFLNGLTHDLGRVAATGQLLAVKAGHGLESAGSAAVKGAAGTIVAGEHGVGHIKDGVKQVQHDGKENTPPAAAKAAMSADQQDEADFYESMPGQADRRGEFESAEDDAFENDAYANSDLNEYDDVDLDDDFASTDQADTYDVSNGFEARVHGPSASASSDDESEHGGTRAFPGQGRVLGGGGSAAASAAAAAPPDAVKSTGCFGCFGQGRSASNSGAVSSSGNGRGVGTPAGIVNYGFTYGHVGPHQDAEGMAGTLEGFEEDERGIAERKHRSKGWFRSRRGHQGGYDSDDDEIDENYQIFRRFRHVRGLKADEVKPMQDLRKQILENALNWREFPEQAWLKPDGEHSLYGALAWAQHKTGNVRAEQDTLSYFHFFHTSTHPIGHQGSGHEDEEALYHFLSNLMGGHVQENNRNWARLFDHTAVLDPTQSKGERFQVILKHALNPAQLYPKIRHEIEKNQRAHMEGNLFEMGRAQAAARIENERQAAQAKAAAGAAAQRRAHAARHT